MVIPEHAMVELLRQAHDVVREAHGAGPAKRRLTAAERPIAFRAVLEHLIRNEETPTA